jgi:hypothetical protein
MYSVPGNAALPALGFPIRRSAGQRLFSASPRLIAAVHVLRRLLVPRHPPCALSILTVSTRSPKRSGDVSVTRKLSFTCSFQAPPRPAGGVLPPFGLWKLSSARAPARPPEGGGAGVAMSGRHSRESQDHRGIRGPSSNVSLERR